MKKSTVILISILAVAFFLSLVYYGVRHSRGTPVDIEEPAKNIILNVPFLDREIVLADGLSLDLWAHIPSKEIELTYQVMVLPWGKSLVSPIFVKAFYNKKDIYFYITWNDQSENRTRDIGKYTDSTAILFPMDEKTQPNTLMMGFLGSANIWQWKATQDKEFWLKKTEGKKAYVDFYYPFEEEELFIVSKEKYQSAANDLMAIRVGTITAKEIQNIEGKGIWENGTWHVIFKRSFIAEDPEIDAGFVGGEKKLCAFAVWEGESGDRGGRKSISDWVELDVE